MMQKSQKFEIELDTSGLYCPYPLAKAKAALKKLKVGQRIRVISTDPASTLDFKVFAETSKHKLLESFHKEGKYIYLIEKSSS